jgi:hypothetical protein
MTIFPFPKIKEILKGRHFDDIDDIRCNTTAVSKFVLKCGLGVGIDA